MFRSLDATRILYNLTLRSRLSAMKRPYDVVVGFDYDGWALRGNVGSRYVVALKGVAADERTFETGWTRLKFGLYSTMEARNARSAELVFVTSEHSRKVAVAAYGLSPERLRLAPEGIDPTIASVGPREAWRGGAPDALSVLTVARQYRRKDIATLIRAVPGLLESVPQARLRIVGDGPEADRNRRLASKLGVTHAVSFLGSLESVDALRHEYERASVFCLPSRQEGFGIVFLEAMSHGLPIVAAAAGAVTEVAPHQQTSLLVPPGDSQAVAEALARLLTQPDLAQRLGTAGIKRAGGFSWPAAARAFLDGLHA